MNNKKEPSRLINKTILIVSPENWDHIKVSKHHYAIHLGRRGNKVFFLNPPQRSPVEVRSTNYQNVYQINYSGFIRGLKYFPEGLQRFFIRKKFKSLERVAGSLFDVVWSFDNSVFYNFRALPKSVLTISHIVDLNQDFNFKQAASTANICFGVSSRIVDKLLTYNVKSFFINHGFSKEGILSKIVPLPGINKYKAVYAGNLSMNYLDWKTLYSLCKKNEQVDFIFIGPGSKNLNIDYKRKCYQLGNTYYLGKIESELLLSMYQSADILLVIYQEAFHNFQSNPHKMMEYLGSGKLVIATKTEEYSELEKEHLIVMSNRNEEILDLFQESVKSIDSLNSEELQRKRMEFAMNHTYSKQIERIEEKLKLL